jgi:hypothetical protein
MSARFLAFRIPSVFHIKNGMVYDVSEEKSRLLEYFEGKKWRTMKAVHWIFGPFGPLSAILVFFVRIGVFATKTIPRMLSTRRDPFQWTIVVSFALIGILVARRLMRSKPKRD